MAHTPNLPVTPVMAARAFEALTKGGQVRVEVIPGSATPKTAAARSQQILDMAKAGMFTPQMLPVTAEVLDMIGLDRSDDLSDRFDRLVAEVHAQQPPPQAMEAMKIQAQQQAQQAQIESVAQIEAIKVHGQVEIETMKAQLAAQVDAQKHSHEIDKQAFDHHHDAAMAFAKPISVPSAGVIAPNPGATGASSPGPPRQNGEG